MKVIVILLLATFAIKAEEIENVKSHNDSKHQI